MKVLVLTDFPERYLKLEKAKLYSEKEKSVLINRYTGTEDFHIKDVIFERDFIKILFKDYEDINLTGSLINCSIVIEETERMELEEGKFYYYELIGMDIISGGEVIGKLESVENYGGQDLLKIRLNEGKKEALIPFIDDFIKKIDADNRKIEIEVIDGMLN